MNKKYDIIRINEILERQIKKSHLKINFKILGNQINIYDFEKTLVSYLERNVHDVNELQHILNTINFFYNMDIYEDQKIHLSLPVPVPVSESLPVAMLVTVPVAVVVPVAVLENDCVPFTVAVEVPVEVPVAVPVLMATIMCV